MPETAAWPYDADQHDPLTALRIPVTSFNPRWAYLLAFDGGPVLGSPVRPTDAEAAMMASWIEYYIDYWYTETWKRRLAERPFDIDGGANGLILHKRAEGAWCYKRRTWQTGFWPHFDDPQGPCTLLQVLDHAQTVIHEVCPKWVAWKAAHPEVFPQEATR